MILSTSFQTPILLLIFNRPDTVQRVFNQIRKIKPTSLFIAADGPRTEIEVEREKCAAARSIINKIDWNSSAINWFFDNVEEGIILEDDCVPDTSFFYFCSLLLEKYRNDSRVMMICGTSYLFNRVKKRDTYFFSKFYSVWGWATWKRAWRHYDFEFNDWKNLYKKNLLLGNFLIENFNKVDEKKLDTWDFPWFYTCLFKDGLAATPINNLVTNIGVSGAHAKGNASPSHFMEVRSINLNEIKHPEKVALNWGIEKIVYKNIKKLVNLKKFSPLLFFKTFLRKLYFLAFKKNL